ncbi:uncharacterized protein FOMMEDRAFT_170966 [Fomitiporia mediterranea MF3/22]|uniref:uncharacterized protein n=1 Tax=Fomitiporia mediterranea (strain MF3/22) TaxID=694068 RepID=UPI0004407A31|nr:uncharacterized protein FOMMEDRAFT_170966 [Fomitiporia mediterranea MF3/22]EJC98766.1 hypothetical protein FOMMEDRAFT_170966 [Fomitiporia mediterranea MF3/22]
MSAGNSAPQWQRVIEEALEQDKKANVYQFATIQRSDSLRDVPIPCVRSLIHRAFVTPRSAAHPFLLTTTDARTPKVSQLAKSPYVELAWWFPQQQSQMRIAGFAYVYPAPDFILTGADTAPGEKKRDIERSVAGLRGSFPGTELAGGGEFDWEKERRARFDGMSGHMRASWLRPVPGTRLVDPNSAKEWPETVPKLEEVNQEKGGEKNLKKQVEDALRNFALVVIDPIEVDYVELGVIPNRRTRFFKEGWEWKEEALVP